MRLTTKARYAVTAMLDIALHDSKGPVCLADVAERQGISHAYLEQLFAKLRRCSLVSSIRGPGGGYTLGSAAAEIYVVDIVEAVGEGVDATNCAGQGDCQGGSICLTHNLWAGLSTQINDFLSGISLAELMQQRDVKTVSARQSAKQMQMQTKKVALTLQAVD